ncbi:hypothetical protein Tco_0986610 [Tanacetum coccineum]
MVPLIEPLSVENLVGEASTSRLPVIATITALSTTFIQASTILPVSVVDHEASDAGPSTEVPSPSKIVFEKEELETKDTPCASLNVMFLFVLSRVIQDLEIPQASQDLFDPIKA